VRQPKLIVARPATFKLVYRPGSFHVYSVTALGGKDQKFNMTSSDVTTLDEELDEYSCLADLTESSHAFL
jgi:hypothetical protein